MSDWQIDSDWSIDMSQTERILWHFKNYGAITPLQALYKYGIYRLASRIHDLKRQGYDIKRETVTVKNRFGEDVKITKYWRGE